MRIKCGLIFWGLWKNFKTRQEWGRVKCFPTTIVRATPYSGRVHLCHLPYGITQPPVSGGCVISYGRWRSVLLRWVFNEEL